MKSSVFTSPPCISGSARVIGYLAERAGRGGAEHCCQGRECAAGGEDPHVRIHREQAADEEVEAGLVRHSPARSSPVPGRRSSRLCLWPSLPPRGHAIDFGRKLQHRHGHGGRGTPWHSRSNAGSALQPGGSHATVWRCFHENGLRARSHFERLTGFRCRSPFAGGLYEHGQKLLDLMRACGHDFGDPLLMRLPDPPPATGLRPGRPLSRHPQGRLGHDLGVPHLRHLGSSHRLAAE